MLYLLTYSSPHSAPPDIREIEADLAELERAAHAEDVLNAAALYRAYRQRRIDSFTVSEANHYAAMMDDCLTAMRRAAGAYNGMGV